MQEAAYHTLSALHFEHPLPLSAFVSTLVTLGAKPDVLKAAGFDARSSNVPHAKAEREVLLGDLLTLVQRVSR